MCAREKSLGRGARMGTMAINTNREPLINNVKNEDFSSRLHDYEDASFYQVAAFDPNIIYHPLANLGCQNFAVHDEEGNEIETCLVTNEDQIEVGQPEFMKTNRAKEVDSDVQWAANQVVPSTVKIEVKGFRGQSWSGSGYILNHDFVSEKFPGIPMEDGTYYILTNHHVASNAQNIEVITADKQHKFTAEVVSRNGSNLLDEPPDCALIRIKIPKKSGIVLPTVEVADSRELSQGETVITAGYPLGLPNVSITKGIISQSAQQTGQFLMGIQADAAINPGNSGGPLFTLDGKVVGTNTYTFNGANDMSFANSTIEQIDILAKIWNDGKLNRGNLNMSFRPLDSATRFAAGIPSNVTGAIIASVAPDSIAAKQGIEKGDILISIEILNENGTVQREIDVDLTHNYNLTTLTNDIFNLKPGEKVKLNVLRKIDVEGGFRYADANIEMDVSEYAPMKYVDATSWGFTAYADSEGIVVMDVEENSPAGDRNIESGGKWLIVGVRSPDLFDYATQSVTTGNNLQEMINYLDEQGSEEITLYLRDFWDSSITRRVTLRRYAEDALLASIVEGARVAIA